MTKKTRLPVVVQPSENATIIELQGSSKPIMAGDEDENLLCGKCGFALTRGVSAATVTERILAPVQLLFKCPKCAAYNRLPARTGH